MVNLQAQPLDESYNKVQGFYCGNNYLDNYLLRTYQALEDHISNLASTTTIIDRKAHKVVAYITTRCSSLKISEEEVLELGLQDEYVVPAVEVKCLAVDLDYQNQGLGDKILKSIVGKSIEFSRHFGCRYVFLWAVPELNVLAFYKKRKFEIMETIDKDNNLRLMRFLIPEIDSNWFNEA
ncbi:GNAT family N-acetyltransferase [Virgibacillus sp. CBA3643]|uniref:GNAT family N-acetyltransferase n=1 Tax=Virgibacillus sp. CBA3643 TaxID=2942278 RepID=UPI0035A32144